VMILAQAFGGLRTSKVEYWLTMRMRTRTDVDVTQLDDTTLMRAIAQKQELALGELYDRYGRLVYTIAYRLVRNPESAEEITLDIFTSIWHKAHTYQPDQAQVNTWLTHMTRNRAIDRLRREAARPHRHSVSWTEVSTEPDNQRESPETAVHLTLQQQKVRAAIATLSEEQQEVLALAYFNGYSHSEIAETLNQPLGTIKGRIRAGMQKLRFLLQDV
ncbi:MAG: sigma-70 family RNA polymerase sigma factor, partial [Ardenticatenaceae bacterium]|nr:sigma-70 family RNA polymerase sigma factor [Ardenticatenaceae bacterium]